MAGTQWCHRLSVIEMPELDRSVVEALRQRLEDGEVTVSRVSEAVRYRDWSQVLHAKPVTGPNATEFCSPD
jgi:hypothetical protein